MNDKAGFCRLCIYAQTRKGAHTCVRKKMNKPKRIICLLLAVIMTFSVCAMFASCEKKKDGTLLATYDGGEVYESDIADWQSYFLIERISEVASSEDYQAKIAEINDATTEFYVKLKAFRKLLQDKGVTTFTDESIKKYAENVLKPALEEAYSSEGGYEHWKTSYGVSDNFLYDYAEEELITAYLEQYVMNNYGVTEELIDDYWKTHAYLYLVVPSYIFDVIMVSVADSDKGNAEAWDAAKAEAQRYIDRIKAGEDFASVKAEAIQNSKNERSSDVYSTQDSIPVTDCRGFDDEESNLKTINDHIDALAEAYDIKLVEYADPNGDDKEYELWFTYCNMLNEFYTKNAMLNLEVGETIAAPIRHIEGYEIIKLLEKSDTVEFQSPYTNETVYNDIYETLYEELWGNGSGSAVETFESELVENYHVVITYSYVKNYTAAT